MVAQHFRHVRAWVFDLDNTLYPPEARLFDQIEARMVAFVMRALGLDRASADRLRADYLARYGTTLAGLMAVHGLDPADYLIEVHDIDLSHLAPEPALASAIAALPGRKIVYTNGTRAYATRVLAARGLSGNFDAVYGVHEAGYLPKPDPRAFQTVFARDGIDASRAAMFEDDPRNLTAPHAMGMRTVHVAAKPAPADHIHHHTDDLAAFLHRLAP
ncbi:putative hydrolase of the HAD superfamily [Rhodobacteraceae bacterium MBR-64]|jgi:putative hydrolase of the HAD superfamily